MHRLLWRCCFIDEDEIVKIDYELSEKIGATHYRECIGDEVDYYKLINNGLTLLCYSQKCGEWDESISNLAVALTKIKPIPPKRARTEYVKITESIFDLRDEFERGELWCKNLAGNEDYQPLNTEVALFGCAAAGNVFRKVEKEIDWREEAKAMVDDEHSYILIDGNGIVDALISPKSKVNFPELCRVTLRALGEL